ncbi:hypothetical protein ACFWRG_13345 [Micromonospora tulbaghiae]|uniref:hypothetical protein n=1 Tax=Micromonospora tulbaghiae TaxID=479978 RepID=UPI0036627D3F
MHSYARRGGWWARRSLVPVAVLAAALASTPTVASATPDTSAVDAAGTAAAAAPGDPALPDYPGLTPRSRAFAAVSTTPIPCGNNGSDKNMQRSDAVKRARSWLSVGGVPYSQNRCYENQYGDYRTDCSGFVAMAWGLGGSGSSFWTGNLDSRSHTISRSDLAPGDALLRHTGDTSENHVALFVKWSDSAHTAPVVIEQTGSSDTIERTWTSSYASLYTPVRYDNILEDVSPEDVPISGDWNNDGIDTVGVFRPSNSTFYLRDTNSGDATRIFKFGHGPSGDQPVAGDWNNNGYDSVGVFRPSNSTWYLTNGTTTATNTTDHEFKFGHGPSGDQPVAGDWNNNGHDSVGVFRPSNSTWYLTNGTTTATNTTDHEYIFGHGPSGDIAIPGRWIKNSNTTPGVRRPSNNTVYLRNTNNGGPVDTEFVYGI